jgi:hypothetical protein
MLLAGLEHSWQDVLLSMALFDCPLPCPFPVLDLCFLQDWNTPGKMWCDGPRQQAVFKACMPTANSSSTDNTKSSASRPSSRTPVVAAAAAESGSSSSSEAGLGGGAVHVVPAGSSHGSFTDLPFLMSPWVTNLLRKTVSQGCCRHFGGLHCVCLLQSARSRT